jgi:hypothetical protein
VFLTIPQSIDFCLPAHQHRTCTPWHTGYVDGLPPVLDYSYPELQPKVNPDVLEGKKFIYLSISEAFSGSDVGRMQKYTDKCGANKWVFSAVCLNDKDQVCARHPDA